MDRGPELHLGQSRFAGDDGVRRSHLSIRNSGRPRLLVGRDPSNHLPLAGELPFYYICKTHSVPGYLQLRYGEGARSVSAVSFAVMTILMSGINMYSMAIIMKVILGWNIHFSIWVSSLTVALYVMAGRVTFGDF